MRILDCPCWPTSLLTTSSPPPSQHMESTAREIILQTTDIEGVTTEYQRTVDVLGNVHEFQVRKVLSLDPQSLMCTY